MNQPILNARRKAGNGSLKAFHSMAHGAVTGIVFIRRDTAGTWYQATVTARLEPFNVLAIRFSTLAALKKIPRR